MTRDQSEQDLREIVVRHEQKLGGFEADLVEVKTMVRSLGQELSSEIRSVKAEVTNKGRTNWTMVSVIVVVAGGLAAMYLAPVRAQLDRNSAAIDRFTTEYERGKGELERLGEAAKQREAENIRSIDERQVMKAREAAITEKLAEVETQFHESRNLQNITTQFQLMMLNRVLRESGKEPYDMPTFWPSSVPARIPGNGHK